MDGFTRVRVVRYGGISTVYGQPDEPDVYAEVTRVRLFRWRWQLFTTRSGRLTEPSYAWTEAGARAKAVFAGMFVEVPR